MLSCWQGTFKYSLSACLWKRNLFIFQLIVFHQVTSLLIMFVYGSVYIYIHICTNIYLNAYIYNQAAVRKFSKTYQTVLISSESVFSAFCPVFLIPAAVLSQKYFTFLMLSVVSLQYFYTQQRLHISSLHFAWKEELTLQFLSHYCLKIKPKYIVTRYVLCIVGLPCLMGIFFLSVFS